MQPCLSNYTIPRVVKLKTIVLYCRRNARFPLHTSPSRKSSECAAHILHETIEYFGDEKETFMVWPFNETSLDTPARQSLHHFVKPVKRPIGRPKTTWLSTVVNDLKEHSSIQVHQNLDTVFQQLEIICSDRTETVCSTMLSEMTNVH